MDPCIYDDNHRFAIVVVTNFSGYFRKMLWKFMVFPRKATKLAADERLVRAYSLRWIPKLIWLVDKWNQPLSRDVGYMRICDCICDRIFRQNPHIAYFSTYNGIFKIAYAKTMPHMQKFAHLSHISAHAIAFFSIFLVQRCFKTAKYFGDKRLPVFTIKSWIN